jgi:hypothetical protein
MNKDLLIIIMAISILYLFYEINNLKKIEGFTTNTATQEQINTAVKRIYLADVEAIRLLSNFAIQLSQGGTTVPGSVTFSGDISLTSGKVIDLGSDDTTRGGYNAGKISYGHPVWDSSALCIVGKGTNDSNRRIRMWDNVIVNKDLNVTGHTYLSGVIDMGINHVGRANTSTGRSGVIEYGPNNSLRIAGRGDLSGNKLVTVSDDLTVTNNLTVNGSLKVGKWTFTDGANEFYNGASYSESLIIKNENTNKKFILHKDGHFRVPDGIISTDQDIEFGSSFTTENKKPWRLVGQTNAAYLMERKGTNNIFLTSGPDYFGGAMTQYIFTAGAVPKTM